jgi:hypothetical protein
MADAIRTAFSKADAALLTVAGRQVPAMIEILFMAQLVRNPLQAIARRWYCRSLFRVTRGRRRCGERTSA